MAVIEVSARDGCEALKLVPSGIIARSLWTNLAPGRHRPFLVFESIEDALGHPTTARTPA